jgi:hypothetical protein
MLSEQQGYWKKPNLDGRLQHLIEKRLDRLDAIAHIMEGDHAVSFPPQKNHLDRWEMVEVERVNKWRTPDSRIANPTPAMYEASRLQRYLPEEMREVQRRPKRQSAAADG